MNEQAMRRALPDDVEEICAIYNAAIAEWNSTFETEPRSAADFEARAAAAERRGFHKMIGKLFTDNLASVHLVERCGFKTVGVHLRHGQLDGSWRDVLVVERLLATPSPAT